jgi:hypothetical protein
MREPDPDISSSAPQTVTEAARQRVVDAIERHYLEGRLTVDELDERLGLALMARSQADLARAHAGLSLVQDAPAPRSAGRRRPRRNGRSVRAEVSLYLAVMATLVLVWALSGPSGSFWPVWPMLGWGIPLLMRHGGLKACFPAHSGRRYRM